MAPGGSARFAARVSMALGVAAARSRPAPAPHAAYSAFVKLARFNGSQCLRDLTMATWQTGLGQVKRSLPAGFEATGARRSGACLGGRFCAREVKLGVVPAPPYSGINLRTYVRDRDGTPAIFILQSRVTPPGMGALLLGLPVRATAITARAGLARGARWHGISFRYELGRADAELPPLEPAIGELEWLTESGGNQAAKHQTRAGLLARSNADRAFDARPGAGPRVRRTTAPLAALRRACRVSS